MSNRGSWILQDALKSKAWKDTLLSQMAEQMQSELAPLLSQKVRETVKDTVRLVLSEYCYHHCSL